jgi:hypothetical protein
MPDDVIPVKLIKTIVKFMATSMGINIQYNVEFIIRTTLFLFEANLPNEKDYNRAIEQLRNMGKKVIPYEEIIFSHHPRD